MKRWILACFALLSLLMVVASPATAKPGDNGGPGNSGAAHLCQQGGWQTLAPAENDAAAFGSQDECVSYGAKGGSIVDHVLYPAVNVTVIGNGGSHCNIQVNLVDFAANTTYAVDVVIYNGGVYNALMTTDADGAASGSPIGTYFNGGGWVQVTSNGITTPWTQITC